MTETRQREHVYAVLRFDLFADEPEHKVTVKEIVTSQEVALAEVERLNRLNADKDCIYFSQVTRFFPNGDSAGSSPDGASPPAV